MPCSLLDGVLNVCKLPHAASRLQALDWLRRRTPTSFGLAQTQPKGCLTLPHVYKLPRLRIRVTQPKGVQNAYKLPHGARAGGRLTSRLPARAPEPALGFRAHEPAPGGLGRSQAGSRKPSVNGDSVNNKARLRPSRPAAQGPP